jgi:hypothetical protein
MQAFELAEAIRESKLPNANKMELFLDAVGRGNPEHRYVAMLQIRRLDEARYTKLLLETLEQTPDDVEGEYWKCPEARYTRLAVRTNDDQIWRSLEKAAKHAKIGFRMELLNHVWYAHDDEEDDNDRRRARCLNLLGAFLDDAAVRDTTIDAKKFNGPCAGFMYEPRLAVRDFVAMEMAGLLEIPVELKPRRTEEEWETIRTKVRQMWKREQERE